MLYWIIQDSDFLNIRELGSKLALMLRVCEIRVGLSNNCHFLGPFFLVLFVNGPHQEREPIIKVIWWTFNHKSTLITPGWNVFRPRLLIAALRSTRENLCFEDFLNKCVCFKLKKWILICKFSKTQQKYIRGKLFIKLLISQSSYLNCWKFILIGISKTSHLSYFSSSLKLLLVPLKEKGTLTPSRPKIILFLRLEKFWRGILITQAPRKIRNFCPIRTLLGFFGSNHVGAIDGLDNTDLYFTSGVHVPLARRWTNQIKARFPVRNVSSPHTPLLR